MSSQSLVIPGRKSSTWCWLPLGSPLERCPLKQWPLNCSRVCCDNFWRCCHRISPSCLQDCHWSHRVPALDPWPLPWFIVSRAVTSIDSKLLHLTVATVKMVDRPLVREEQHQTASKPSAKALVSRKATCKSAKGRKGKQVSKAELNGMERRQSTLEKQVSRAEK